MYRFRPFQVKIETQTQTITEKINLFLIFNGSSAGGLEKFAKESNIQDGLLDVIVIKNCNFAEASVLMGKILAGNHLDDKNIIYLKEKNLKITKIKGKCDTPDVDGEEGPKFPLDVSCIQGGINMFL